MPRPIALSLIGLLTTRRTLLCGGLCNMKRTLLKLIRIRGVN